MGKCVIMFMCLVAALMVAVITDTTVTDSGKEELVAEGSQLEQSALLEEYLVNEVMDK